MKGKINKVLLKCSVEGCPRTKKIEWDDNFPRGTTIVTIKCPWHDDGDFDSEHYYDKDGEEIEPTDPDDLELLEAK